METEDVIRLVSHYRHDIMNQLQIIQGYFDMNKPDKARSKLTDYINQLQEERKLTNLGLPHFALWVLQFDTVYANFRLTYHVQSNEQPPHPHKTDEQLVEVCHGLFEALKAKANEHVLYEVDIQVMQTDTHSAVSIVVTDDEDSLKVIELENELLQTALPVTLHKEKDRLVCEITIGSKK